MEENQKGMAKKKPVQRISRKSINRAVISIRNLQGDPHYVALGMAIGVFVAITPTIPFHTVIAVVLAYLFRASRPAAIIGVWASNPFTVVFFYIACYKTGIMLFGTNFGDAQKIKVMVEAMEGDIHLNGRIHIFVNFFHTQLRLFFSMIAGGVILGIPGGIITYFMTKNFVKKNQVQKKTKLQGAL